MAFQKPVTESWSPPQKANIGAAVSVNNATNGIIYGNDELTISTGKKGMQWLRINLEEVFQIRLVEMYATLKNSKYWCV